MSDFSLLIRKWYRLNKRELPWRDTNDAYHIWLSEIILQQTRVQQGLSYYKKFTSKYPTITHLANAEEKEILNLWQGLGYYSRARNLHSTAKIIRDKYKGKFPLSYEEIISLKGIGIYTASAIVSFAYNLPKSVVDGNVYRVLSRVFDIPTPIDSTLGKKEFQKLADEILDKKEPGEHNQAIMELGAIICKPLHPNCSTCPLLTKCLAKEKGTIAQRPVKNKKTKIRERYFHFFIYTHEEFTYINKRTQKDIWQNLYQFPLIETKEKANIQEKKRWENQFHESNVITHILSHQKIHAIFHHLNFPPDKSMKNLEKIPFYRIEEYPIPRLIEKYLKENIHLF